MARYKLMVDDNDSDGEIEVGGQRKSTKRDIDRWINDNVRACGLDWRAGYTLKFRNSISVYTWRWIKDNKTVSV